MKTKSILTLLVALTGLATVGLADEKKGDDHHAVEIPKTTKEIWSQLNGLEDTVNAAVAKKDAHVVHGRAEQATGLLNALPGKSTELKDIAKKRVDGYVKSLAKILDAAHDAADDGKFDGAAKSMKSYASLIKTLKAQYDKDTTSGKTAEKDLPQIPEKKH
ncbi:MAG: hypothetical protein KDN22_10485 [Verrucomicrobiae bacterium]|nr:hypothetical protein [Verrucomicrobiae bacterium]